MPSALLLNYISGIPPRAIYTLPGRGNNRPSLRARPPCATSFFTGRQPYRLTSCRCFPPHHRPSFFSEIQELASKSRLQITDNGIVLLVRQMTLPPRLTRNALWDARLVH